MNQPIKSHPLLFKLHETVTGCGFLVSVTATGRALMQHDGEQWWMNGVCPGAILAGGATVAEAFANFRTAFVETLFGIAEECSGFLQFKSHVESYFKQEDDREMANWDESLRLIREQQPELPEEFAHLDRRNVDEFEVRIIVDRLDDKKPSQLVPAMNAMSEFQTAA